MSSYDETMSPGAAAAGMKAAWESLTREGLLSAIVRLSDEKARLEKENEEIRKSLVDKLMNSEGPFMKYEIENLKHKNSVLKAENDLFRGAAQEAVDANERMDAIVQVMARVVEIAGRNEAAPCIDEAKELIRNYNSLRDVRVQVPLVPTEEMIASSGLPKVAAMAVWEAMVRTATNG